MDKYMIAVLIKLRHDPRQANNLRTSSNNRNDF